MIFENFIGPGKLFSISSEYAPISFGWRTQKFPILVPLLGDWPGRWSAALAKDIPPASAL